MSERKAPILFIEGKLFNIEKGNVLNTYPRRDYRKMTDSITEQEEEEEEGNKQGYCMNMKIIGDELKGKKRRRRCPEAEGIGAEEEDAISYRVRDPILQCE